MRVIIITIFAAVLFACGGSPVKTESTLQASSVLQSSIESGQAYTQAKQFLAKKNYAAALPLMEIVARSETATAEQFANFGIVLSRSGEYEDALSAFRKAAKQAPNNADVLVEMALVYREQGKFGNARRFYEQALAFSPNHLRANYNLGVLCDLYKEDLDCAINSYRQYLALSGQDDKNVNIWLTDLAKRKGIPPEQILVGQGEKK